MGVLLLIRWYMSQTKFCQTCTTRIKAFPCHTDWIDDPILYLFSHTKSRAEREREMKTEKERKKKIGPTSDGMSKSTTMLCILIRAEKNNGWALEKENERTVLNAMEKAS